MVNLSLTAAATAAAAGVAAQWTSPEVLPAKEMSGVRHLCLVYCYSVAHIHIGTLTGRRLGRRFSAGAKLCGRTHHRRFVSVTWEYIVSRGSQASMMAEKVNVRINWRDEQLLGNS